MSNETKVRPASEIAAEVVGGAAERLGGDWGFTIWARGTDGRDVDLTVDGYVREESADRDSKSLRATIAAVIEQARHEGAVEALREVAGRLDPLASEAREVSGSYHERGDSEGAALEEGKACAYHHAAHVARELASRPRQS